MFITPRIPLIFLLLAVSGCASYSPKPLDAESVRRAFAEREPFPPDAPAAPSGTPFDFTDGLSLPEAEAITLIFNADLRAARSRSGVTRANANNAGLWADPTFGIDLTRILASVDEPWELGIPVGLTVPISGRLAAEKNRARSEHEAELVRVFDAEWATRMRLRTLWNRWSSAADRAQALRDFLGRYSEVSSVIDSLESAGEMPRTEARLFRVDDLTRRAELIGAEAEIEASRLELLALIGFPPEWSVQLVPASLVTTVTDSLGAKDGLVAAGLDLAFSRNTTLALARAEYEVWERRLATEIRAQYPDLTLTGGYGNEDGNDRIITGIGTVVPLWNRNRQGVARASAEREAARIGFEGVAEDLVGEHAAAVVAVAAAERTLDLIQNQLMPLVEQQFDDIRTITRLGEINALLVLETLSRRLEADLALALARANVAEARIRLTHLEGPCEKEEDRP